MELTSIDVIERVLGAKLVPAGWKARSVTEIDFSEPGLQAPAISRRQYLRIQERLEDHWVNVTKAIVGRRGFLFINLRNDTRLHQFTELTRTDLAAQPARSEASWRILVKQQIAMDETSIARQALLYSEGVILHDPAEMLRSDRYHRELPELQSNGVTWKELWQSAYFRLACLEKLVRGGCIVLIPTAMVHEALASNSSGSRSEREREQLDELRSLYGTGQWRALLSGLPFKDTLEAGIYAGWALGQFAWRNVVLPHATPWLPNKACLDALTGIGRALGAHLLSPENLTLARLSSQIGVDVARISDDDIVAMRSNEALFATWRRLVAELCLEAERLNIDDAADVTTLVRSKQFLWRAELEKQIGRGTVLAGLFDSSPIACGIITGGVAVASGMPPALTAASALGGGLVTPLIRLFCNLTGAAGVKAREHAVTAHFLALEG